MTSFVRCYDPSHCNME